MFFELDGKTYRVKFYRVGTTTFAELWSVEEFGQEFTDLVGIATLGKKDIFVKKMGRKVALAHLIEAMKESSLFKDLTTEKKKIIWASYFEKHPKDGK